MKTLSLAEIKEVQGAGFAGCCACTGLMMGVGVGLLVVAVILADYFGVLPTYRNHHDKHAAKD